ncbi:MAG: fibrobacter succinogenes major paralogous domain-containing protein [Flavobacteriales bacterium]|nr:fibrobacter succinogenes major paralogous domain-containing protein [Flavobacteriales bacterium]
MKRFSTLVLVVISFISQVRSQVITITFEGTLNALPIPLDSILVMNLTAGGDTMVYFPDNVLVLDGTTGIARGNQSAMTMQGWPNPFVGSTEVALSATSGELLLTLQDATGRLLKSHTLEVAEGVHRFRIDCGQPGMHLLMARQSAVSRTVRLMAAEGQGASDLQYNGLWGSGRAKDDRSLFTWMPGDELRYIGYATDAGIAHSAAIDEVPVASATRTFALFAGLACSESPTVTDVDGNVYRSVRIGGQCWMAENLKTTRNNDGTDIPNVTDGAAWSQLSSDAWCYYNNSPASAIYGKLYNWYVATNTNICPQGWHVPTDAEWQQLELTLGMPAGEVSNTSFRGAAQNVGGKMKATTLWVAPNTGATNESGFSGLPGGFRTNANGAFNYLGNAGFWWSVSESGAEDAWYRTLDGNDAGVYRFNSAKRDGFCLRCIRD